MDTGGYGPLRGIVTVVVTAAAVGCTHAQALRGPPAPEAGGVSQVVVTRLKKTEVAPIIRDRARIESIAASYAFSASGWSGGDERNLVPLYRIDFHGSSVSTYWLGVYPPAVSLPLYFYRTWWVSPSTETGEIDRTRIKGLSDTAKFRLFQDLGLGSSPETTTKQR